MRSYQVIIRYILQRKYSSLEFEIPKILLKFAAIFCSFFCNFRVSPKITAEKLQCFNCKSGLTTAQFIGRDSNQCCSQGPLLKSRKLQGFCFNSFSIGIKADFLSWQKLLATIFFQKKSVK